MTSVQRTRVDAAECPDCDWIGNRPDVIEVGRDYTPEDVCPECEASVDWIVLERVR